MEGGGGSYRGHTPLSVAGGGGGVCPCWSDRADTGQVMTSSAPGAQEAGLHVRVEAAGLNSPAEECRANNAPRLTFRRRGELARLAPVLTMEGIWELMELDRKDQ